MDGHLHDDESINASMSTYRDGAPATGPATISTPRLMAPRGDLAAPTRDHASASPQANLCRNYATLGPMAAIQAATTGDDHAGGRHMEVAHQNPPKQCVTTPGAQTEAAAGTISGPTERMPTRMAQPWGQDSLGYAHSRGDTQHPSAGEERAAALDPDLLLSKTPDMEQLILRVRTLCLLMDIHHIINGTRIMADVILDHRGGRHSPAPTMEHPSQWRYVANRFMAHMGAYTPGNLDPPHWRWHHRTALRIRGALVRHSIWTIRTPRLWGPAAPDRATGHQRQQSPTTQRSPRQMARTSHSQTLHRRQARAHSNCTTILRNFHKMIRISTTRQIYRRFHRRCEEKRHLKCHPIANQQQRPHFTQF